MLVPSLFTRNLRILCRRSNIFVGIGLMILSFSWYFDGMALIIGRCFTTSRLSDWTCSAFLLRGIAGLLNPSLLGVRLLVVLLLISLIMTHLSLIEAILVSLVHETLLVTTEAAAKAATTSATASGKETAPAKAILKIIMRILLVEVSLMRRHVISTWTSKVDIALSVCIE